jgi:anti-sigma factor ChrR (cupin superfamily)
MNISHGPGEPGEWAALYAAGALPADELAAFEAHLAAGCDACTAELRDLAPVVDALAAATAVPPSPQTRDALLRRAAEAAPVRPSPLTRHLGEVPQDAGLVIRRASDGGWEATDVPGVTLRVLKVDRAADSFTALVRMAPGAAYPRHLHNGPEECLVLEGDLHLGTDTLHAGDYQYAAVGSSHGVQRTEGGCLLLIVSSLSDQFL